MINIIITIILIKKFIFIFLLGAQDLVSLRIPVSPAFYLMGIPDPLGILNPDEIYIPNCFDHSIKPGQYLVNFIFYFLISLSALFF